MMAERAAETQAEAQAETQAEAAFELQDGGPTPAGTPVSSASGLRGKNARELARAVVGRGGSGGQGAESVKSGDGRATPNGTGTPSAESVSSYSSTGMSGSESGRITPRSPRGKAARAAARKTPRRLTAEERELFLRIEKEWREEDAWSHQAPGMLSTIAWTPLLVGLRCFNIWLSAVTLPVSLVARLFGFKMERASFWDVPLERRKQTIAVLWFVLMLPMVAVAHLWSLLLLIFPLTTFPMLCYYVFIFYVDKSSETGSRRPFIRYWRLWRHFSNYFPLRLIKTANLDPSRKYVFAYHPHGIISIGAFGNFATNATGFSRKFPGIDLRLLTLEMNFWCPWIREILLHMGVCSASKRSCNKILSKGPGSAIMLVVGGAAESLDTEPGTYRLTLGRKGFVRVALDNGADLVPVLGFGENDVFDTLYYPKDTWARSIQEYVRKKLGFATPIFYGRGIFNYSLGILPHRKPIIVVVGKPIKLPRLPAHLRGAALSTTAEGVALVDKYHEEYVAALRNLWDLYKQRWAVHRQGSLMVQ